MFHLIDEGNFFSSCQFFKKEMIVSSVQNAVEIVRNGSIFLEKRHYRYMFGTRNYGEMRSIINPADGDPWDVFAPGYKVRLETDVPLLVKNVIGVLILDNGNHKIAVLLHEEGFDWDSCIEEIDRYSNLYCKKKGKWGYFKWLLRNSKRRTWKKVSR